MSVSLRLQNMFEINVRYLLIIECQKGRIRVCSPAM